MDLTKLKQPSEYREKNILHFVLYTDKNIIHTVLLHYYSTEFNSIQFKFQLTYIRDYEEKKNYNSGIK